jgi:hypothetical protein
MSKKLEEIRALVEQIQGADKIGGPLGRGLKGDRAMELATAVEERIEWTRTRTSGSPPMGVGFRSPGCLPDTDKN